MSEPRKKIESCRRVEPIIYGTDRKMRLVAALAVEQLASLWYFAH